MSTDSTKAMEEALQAAVKRLNSGGTDASTDPIGLLASILPKLMSHGEEREELREDLMEKIEGLKKDDIGALREHVQIMRKLLHRVLKTQEQTLAQIREMEKQQVAVSHAVLELARQMARVEIIDELPDEAEIDDRIPPPPPASRARGAEGNHGRVEPAQARK